MRTSRSLIAIPFIAEALTLFHATLFYKEIGITRVIIEGDALQVINQLKVDKMDWSQCGALAEDVRKVLNSYATWLASHDKRAANQMAHLLAKDALELELDMYDLESISNCIKHVVCMDCL